MREEANLEPVPLLSEDLPLSVGGVKMARLRKVLQVRVSPPRVNALELEVKVKVQYPLQPSFPNHDRNRPPPKE